MTVISCGRMKFDEAAFYFTVHGLANEPAFLGCAIVVKPDARAAFVGGDDRVPERTCGETRESVRRKRLGDSARNSA